ncbi:MAG: hypothetical protein II670_08010, partial [Alphaproteobacteria bacterium]|nr:hypothetical protein [Alphaproteobacteria bacterium]
MYKKVLFFVFEVLMFFCTVAQNSVTVRQPHMQNPAQKTIIREYPSHYPSTIACYDSDDSVTFVYYARNMQVSEVTMKNCWVNDFVIYGDTVFFCGKSKTTRSGICGYFSIPDVFASNGDIAVIPILYSGNDSYHVKELTRITTYPCADNTIRVVSIGYCVFRDTLPCLIDINSYNHNPTYVGGYVDNEFETFTDIKVVRNLHDEYYLVTAGFDTENGRYINIRVYDPNNIFAPSGIQNRCHIYCIDTAAARPWLDGGVLLTDLYNGNFVTVSYRSVPLDFDSNRDIVLSNASIHIGIFSLDRIISNYVNAMQDNFEIPIGLLGNYEMDEIIYSNNRERVVFLHSYSTLLNMASDFCCFNPHTLQNSGTLLAHQNIGIKQQGLSLYNNRNNYILSGFKMATPTEINYEMETFGISSSCVSTKEYNYERKHIVNSLNTTREFIYRGHVSEIIKPTLYRADL